MSLLGCSKCSDLYKEGPLLLCFKRVCVCVCVCVVCNIDGVVCNKDSVVCNNDNVVYNNDNVVCNNDSIVNHTYRRQGVVRSCC